MILSVFKSQVVTQLYVDCHTRSSLHRFLYSSSSPFLFIFRFSYFPFFFSYFFASSTRMPKSYNFIELKRLNGGEPFTVGEVTGKYPIIVFSYKRNTKCNNIFFYRIYESVTLIIEYRGLRATISSQDST